MDNPIENQNLNKEHYITAEELIDQLESAGLHEIAATIKDSPKAAYNVAQDILITNKINNMPEGSFPKTNFSKEELEKYQNMSEEIIAQMLLERQKSPIGNKISELRENFNPSTSDNDNKPANK